MSKEGDSQPFDFKLMIEALDAKFQHRIDRAMESIHEPIDQMENSQTR